VIEIGPFVVGHQLARLDFKHCIAGAHSTLERKSLAHHNVTVSLDDDAFEFRKA
jgi:hypothetical protein